MSVLSRLALCAVAAVWCSQLVACSTGEAISGAISVASDKPPAEQPPGAPPARPGRQVLEVDATIYSEEEIRTAQEVTFNYAQALNERDFITLCRITTQFNTDGYPELLTDPKEVEACAAASAADNEGVDLSGPLIAADELIVTDDEDGWAYVEDTSGTMGVYVVKLTDGHIYVDIS